MNTPLAFARLIQFGDSMLPVGAFAFSGGVESAVQKGVVNDATTLSEFTRTALMQAVHGDAVGVAWAARAALHNNAAELVSIDKALFCRKSGEEARFMTTRTGKKLAELGLELTHSELLGGWLEAIRQNKTPGTHPVAFALLMTAAGLCADRQSEEISLDAMLSVFLYGVVMTVLNASLRLMRLSHLDIQRILYGLTSSFPELVEHAKQTPLEHMSTFAPMTDILGPAHVRARVRLFMN